MSKVAMMTIPILWHNQKSLKILKMMGLISLVGKIVILVEGIVMLALPYHLKQKKGNHFRILDSLQNG